MPYEPQIPSDDEIIIVLSLAICNHPVYEDRPEAAGRRLLEFLTDYCPNCNNNLREMMAEDSEFRAAFKPPDDSVH